MLPDDDVQQVRAWCASRVPDALRDQVRVECEVADRHLTVVERRPPWDGAGGWTSMPVARLRYTARTGEWTLFAAMSDGRFRTYDPVTPTSDVSALLGEVDRDPTGVFWG